MNFERDKKMNLDAITKIAHEEMGSRKEHKYRERGFLLNHGLRVGKIAINLRKKIYPNESSMDHIIYVGALFHDLCKGNEPHSENGSKMISKLIKEFCSESELMKIEEIILLHNKRNTVNDFEKYIKLVQDADVLDHFGTVEIWQNSSQNGQTEEGILGTLEWYNSSECVEYNDRSIKSLNYDISKKIFEDRISFVELFRSRLTKENNGEILI